MKKMKRGLALLLAVVLIATLQNVSTSWAATEDYLVDADAKVQDDARTMESNTEVETTITSDENVVTNENLDTDETNIGETVETEAEMESQLELRTDIDSETGIGEETEEVTELENETPRKMYSQKLDEIGINTGNFLFKVISEEDKDNSQVDYEKYQYAFYDADGNYEINVPEDNPFFPYEVQFTYGYKTESKWFMSPSDSVTIGGHKFTLSCHIDDQVITSVYFNVGGKDILAYPESKEFTNDGGISTTSLLPLEEQHLVLDLTQYDFTPIELSMIRYGRVYSGDKELGTDVAKFALRSDEDYKIYNSDEIIPLRNSSNQSIEVIVGDGDQLTSSNVRCRVDIKKPSSYHFSNWLSSSLYVQNDNSRKEMTSDENSCYMDYAYVYVDGSKYSGNGSLYLNLNIDKDSFSDANYKSIKVFSGKYTDVDSIPSENDITNQILSEDMTIKDAGFKIEKEDFYITMVTYGENEKVTGCLPFEIFIRTSSARINYWPIVNDYIEESSTIGGIHTTTYKLTSTKDTNITVYASASFDENRITAVFVGEKTYDSIADANTDNAEEIKEKLFDESIGYTADYSKGLYFTVFLGDDNDEDQIIKKQYIAVTVNKKLDYDIVGNYNQIVDNTEYIYVNGKEVTVYTISPDSYNVNNTECSCYASYSEASESAVDKVKAVYVGKEPYYSIDEAKTAKATEVNVDELFNDNIGYKADYSEGIYFSVFVDDGNGNMDSYINLVKVKAKEESKRVSYKLVSQDVATYEDYVDGDDVHHMTYTLKDGYNADTNYVVYAIYTEDGDDMDNKVTAAYVGLFDTIKDAEKGSKDIKDDLFDKTKGYKANYSNGVYFTVFVGNDGDNQQKYQTYIKIKDAIKSSETDISFDAVKDASGNEIKVYVNNSADDTYAAEYNFITLIADTDINNIAPVFTMYHNETVYTNGQIEKSGESYHDFSNGAIQYTVTSEDGEHQKNYWLQVVKPTEGEKIYINSLEDSSAQTETKDGIVYTTREVMLDDRHSNVHNIFIANIGLENIKNLKVELDSTALKLDSYWTLSGKNDLETFNIDHVNSRYSDNIAKVVLRKNDDVKYGTAIEGTLTIKSGDKKLMVINLTGVVGSPIILTDEIPNAVKYVPYGVLIQNSNKYSWNETTYSVTNGSLPDGMILKPDGEIYGVPKESGEFTFTVAMENSSDKIEKKTNSKEFTFSVVENTNENVDSAVDTGYEITEKIGTIRSKDNLVVSQGLYENFVDLYIDGDKLERGVDYTAESGSTRLTISGQALKRGSGTHTIGIEFREKDSSDASSEGTLKRAAQNYKIGGGSGSSSSSSSSEADGNDSASTDDSSSGSEGTGNGGSSADEEAVTVATFDDGYTMEQINLTSDHILRASLLREFYGKNTYLVTIMQPDFGIIIDMAKNPVLEKDIEIIYNQTSIEALSPEFDTILVKANMVNNLGFDAIFNFNVGEQYIGKKAYVYMLNEEETGYDLILPTAVNEIGNVAFTVNRITDFIILIEK